MYHSLSQEIFVSTSVEKVYICYFGYLMNLLFPPWILDFQVFLCLQDHHDDPEQNRIKLFFKNQIPNVDYFTEMLNSCTKSTYSILRHEDITRKGKPALNIAFGGSVLKEEEDNVFILKLKQFLFVFSVHFIH